MNRASLAVFLMAIFSGSSAAQAPAGAPAAGGMTLVPGTTVSAELGAAIDSKKAKAGDAVVAHTTEAVKADGKTLIPKGAKLAGHITQASARAKGDSDSALGILFDRAIMKNGPEIPLSVWIRAISAPAEHFSEGGRDLSSVTGDVPTIAAGSPMGGRGQGGMSGGGTPAPANGTANNPPASAGGNANDPGGAAGSSSGNSGGSNAAGQLNPNSRGVFGINGVRLAAEGANAAGGSLITGSGKNLRLESGTRLLLVVAQAEDAAAPKR